MPIEMFEPAVKYLRDVKKIAHISTYGQSMGSVFAALTVQYISGIENVIMVSPTHVPFEGTTKNKKNMTGHSVAAWRARDIPSVKPDFGKVKMSKYYRHSAARYKVMEMWTAFYDAYQDKRKTIKSIRRSEYADFSLRCRRTGLQSGK